MSHDIKMADEIRCTGVTENGEDIFDENVSDNSIASKEWEKIQSGLQEGGFREGLTIGKETNLQLGFNSGFADGAKTLYELAKQRGKISASLSIQVLDGSDPSVTADLQTELNHFRKLEHDLICAAESKTTEQLKLLKNQQLF